MVTILQLGLGILRWQWKFNAPSVHAATCLLNNHTVSCFSLDICGGGWVEKETLLRHLKVYAYTSSHPKSSLLVFSLFSSLRASGHAVPFVVGSLTGHVLSQRKVHIKIVRTLKVPQLQ